MHRLVIVVLVGSLGFACSSQFETGGLASNRDLGEAAPPDGGSDDAVTPPSDAHSVPPGVDARDADTDGSEHDDDHDDDDEPKPKLPPKTDR